MRTLVGAGAFILTALSQAPAQNVVVRGTAWDSLRGAPLSGAMISIAGTRRTAISDSRGRFAFDGIAPGPYTFVMQHDVLDSIGFSGRQARATISAENPAVTVFVPTFAVLWRALCGSTAAPSDSAIVYGFVRTADGERPVRDAKVAVAWADVSYQRKEGFDEKQWGATVSADTTGRYVLCGVPSTTGIQLAAANDSMISGRVAIGPLAIRVMKQDLSVAPRSASDPVTTHGVIAGEVRGFAGGPLADALVYTEGVPEVRSNAEGRFVLRNVPAGSRQVMVRAIGAEQLTEVVNVRPGDTTTVVWTLKRAVTLEEVNVTARGATTHIVRGILERKQAGLGYFRDSTDLGKMNEMAHVFDTFNGIRVVRDRRGNGFTVTTALGQCMSLFIDRSLRVYGELSLLRPDDIALVEVYPRVYAVPDEFRTREGCGALVVWTKRYLK